MSRRHYDQTIPWTPSKPWETYKPSEPPDLALPERDPKVFGIIFAFLLLYVIVVAIGFVVLAIRGTITDDVLVWLLAGVGVLIWVPAGVLIFREYYNSQQVIQVVTPAEPAEVIRFIRLSTDDLVDPRDLAFFLQRIEVTGKLGKNSIRGLPFPSGKRGSDAYHEELTQALTDAGLWEPSTGPGVPPKLKASPQEALNLLGLTEL